MPSGSKQELRIVDGQFDWSGGMDSGKPTTIATPAQPFGVPRNMLAWLTNGTCRGGGISTRTGWLGPLAEIDPAQFQGGIMYEPEAGLPYLILSIGGRILLVHVDTDNSIVDLSAQFGLANPATTEKTDFCQADQFLVIQPGDGVTLPLFWDGTTLRRSIGITNTAVAPGTPGINEIPAATFMVYYQGRLWYAQNYTLSAGDIVGGNSGTVVNGFKDSVLNVTENPMVVGGDGFAVPTRAGTIRALAYTANIDTTLGQGPLYIFTAKEVYQLTVPTTRADWIAATNTNAPKMTVAQVRWGTVSDRSVVHINGDLYYRTLEPGIRSLILAVRYVNQFGNTPISRNINRIMQSEDRSLLHMASGIEFDNRLWQTCIPVQTPVGVGFRGIAILDFDIVSGLQDKLSGTALPAWEGMYEPGTTLQLFEDDFGGRQRAFAMMLSSKTGKIQVWEPTTFAKSDPQDRRVTMVIHTPAYNWNSPLDEKTLDNMELWLDKVSGLVDIVAEYREDANPCWHPWAFVRLCTERSCPTAGYPQPIYCESGAVPVTFPKAPAFDCNDQNQRPVNIGCQFQIRLTIKGWCRIRGLRIWARARMAADYEGIRCVATQIGPPQPPCVLSPPVFGGIAGGGGLISIRPGVIGGEQGEIIGGEAGEEIGEE